MSSFLFELLSWNLILSGFIGLVTIGIILYHYWWKLPHPQFPPGFRGIPVMGALPYLGKSAHTVMAKWSRDKFGPIMSVRFGSDDVVVLSTYDVIHEVSGILNDEFENAFELSLKTQTTGKNRIMLKLLCIFGQVRQFSLSTLRGLGIGKRSIETRISEIAQDMVKELDTLDGKPTNVKMIVGTSVANVICSIVFGKSFEHNDPAFRKLCIVLIQTIPFLLRLMSRLFFTYTVIISSKPGQHMCDIFQDFNRKEIEEHIENLDENEPSDYIDAFLIEMKKHSPDDPWFHEKQLLHSISDLFIAGTETTTTTLLWCMIAMLHYPDLQARIYNELMQEIGEQVLPSVDHRDKLPLFRAFIQEILRYKTTVILGIQHLTTKDVDIKGYRIPKDTKVTANIDACHSDPNVWKDPSKFDIHRHIDKDGKFILSRKVIPFGIGARSCLGEKLARIEIYLFLANIIKRFEILPDPKSEHLPPFDDGLSGLIHSPFSYKVSLKPRI
uniref:Uncharacterized protein n=1 Tax=Ciona savignyi TaxID=51511 RepID=H2ZLZ3_CIOSA